MSKQASPTVVGAFVVGASILAVGGILTFGSGDIFKKENRFVAFFESSVAGLDIGAPVRFKGVEVGSVEKISAVWTQQEDIRIPVQLLLTEGTVESLEEDRDRMGVDAFLEHLVQTRGLRAELRQDSFVTGKLFVALDFQPDMPIRRVGGSKLVEIPTVEGGLSKITKKLEANEGLLGRLLAKQGRAKHQVIFAQLEVPQAAHFRVVFEQAARQSDEVPAPRLVRGDVEKAVRTLEHAMTYLKAAKNYGEAFRHLDQANKALMEARVALWEQRGAGEKKGGNEKQEKPVRNERSKKRP